MEEDPTLSYLNNAETHQQIIGGLGEQHLDVVKAKLKNKFGVEIGLEAPRIAYRESIRKACQKQGRHKKQTGGHGQFGDVVINFEPCDSEQVVFEEKVFGGSVPKNFFPAVEKGCPPCRRKGRAGRLSRRGPESHPAGRQLPPRGQLRNGLYHGRQAGLQGCHARGRPRHSGAHPHPEGASSPTTTPATSWATSTKRRGRVLGMEPDEDGLQTIIAEVPLAELSNFTTFIRQTTQGRGWFTTEFARYEILPENAGARRDRAG